MLTPGCSRARSAAECRAAVTGPVTFFAPDSDMSARRILVVDDNNDVRYIVAVLLERSGGYETLEAATGQEAVEKAISGRPDLILMDIRLPDISGVDATKAIKNNPRTEQIPIVAYSALPFVGWKQQAFQAGMVAYLQKPVNLKLLMETIQKFIPS
jgi:CheY-like chemotaxis protein